MVQTHTGEELIRVGDVVLYGTGWYRVSRVTKSTVNLTTIFGGRMCHKQVPLSEVKEDQAAWYENWSQSETYMSM